MVLLSHTSLELCIPFTAVNALSFKYESITKPESFFDFCHSYNEYICKPFWADRNDRYPYPSWYVNKSEIPTVLYT